MQTSWASRKSVALLRYVFSCAVFLNINSVGLILFFLRTLASATKKAISKKFGLLTICVISFAALHLSFAGFLGNWVELKLAIVLSAYAIASNYFCVAHESESGEAMFWVLTLYTILALIFVFPIIFRFPDHVEHSLISPYFGTLCVFIFALVEKTWQRAIVFLCCCLAASGTGLVGLLTFLALSKRKNWLTLALAVSVLLGALYASQAARGRIDVDWQEIDRAVLAVGTVHYMVSEFAPHEWIVGAGLNASLPPGYYSTLATLNESVADYVELEGVGFGSGRNFHNEHLRVIYHLGILGWLLFLWCVYRLISNRALLASLLVMGAIGSVFFSPFMFSAVMLAMKSRTRGFASAT